MSSGRASDSLTSSRRRRRTKRIASTFAFCCPLALLLFVTSMRPIFGFGIHSRINHSRRGSNILDQLSWTRRHLPATTAEKNKRRPQEPPSFWSKTTQQRAITSTTQLFESEDSYKSHTMKSLPSISPKIEETLDPCVVLMKQIINEYQHLWTDRGGIFSLAQGVVYWKEPTQCKQKIMDALASNDDILNTYGPAEGIPELVEALQTKLANDYAMQSHNVMVTVGANQAYMNCILTLLNSQNKSKAVVFAPYYFNHVMAIQMTCGDEAVLVGPCSDDGIPSIEWLREQLENDKNNIDMVTIVNPGNPTGVSLDKETLQEFVDLCEAHNIWLVLDCTYEYFTSPQHQPLATFPDSPYVIHIFSFSKSYSLAGYRCGYLVLHEDAPFDAFAQMLKVQDTIPIGPPRISQLAALGSLEAGKEWVYDKYVTLDASREAILQALQPLPTMGGSGAMYCMAQLPRISTTGEHGATTTQHMDDVAFCRTLVKDYGVAIIPGKFCGFPGWIRVCYANLPPAKCLEAAERLQQGIQSIL